MSCEHCNHFLLLDSKRNILALYPQPDKVDMVCMFLGQSQGRDVGGNHICTVLPGWRGEANGLKFCTSSKTLHDKDTKEAFAAASEFCPIDVLFINKGVGPHNFQYVASMIAAARAAHPKINIFSGGEDGKLSVRYRGDESEEEKAEIFIAGQGLVRDLAIAVKMSGES